tara:strand:+ start:502 stop:636 length:135 start_codon:yes stop_codon:yes gene_type:complete
MIPIQAVPSKYKNMVLVMGVTLLTVTIVKSVYDIRLTLKKLKEG